MKRPLILVVDDHALNRKLVADVLTFADYEVVQAETAEAAETLIRARPPELILMDLALPGMDGLTLTRKLKADPATRQIPIVAVTASAMRGDEDKALHAGCAGYITKPIDTRRLPEQVAAYLPRH